MSEKIRLPHLGRKAVLYVRQSSTTQVANSLESQRLQYAMQDRLRDLGWSEIEVIDEDLGRSASGSVSRSGFERMVAVVCLGQVGAVAAREVSRFARNSRDWQQLVEVCRMVDTLLIDQEMVYDPRQGNDRLLLGLKGSLNEYELDLLRQRAVEARRAKARRGELVTSVPVGYIKTDDQRIEMDPNLRVQEMIRLVYRKFFELGAARQVLFWLQDQGLSLPVRSGGHCGEVQWKRPSYCRLHAVLTNPIYAGAYAYGKTEVVPTYDGERTGKSIRRRSPDQWLALIRDHHAGYVSWEDHARVQQMLDSNNQIQRVVKPGAARRGSALLAGLLRCRRCGRKLIVSYTGRTGDVVRYSCCRGFLDNAEPKCLQFGGLNADEAVARELPRVLQPRALEQARAMAATSEHQQADTVAARERELEAAEYEVDRARRQYDAIDPAHRLVATELERRWQTALERRAAIEQQLQASRSTTPTEAALSSEDWDRLTADFTAIWSHTGTDIRLKKRLVRTLIHEILVDLDEDHSETVLTLHWHGGIHSELRVPRRRHGRTRRSTAVEVVEAVRSLNRVLDDLTLAGYLNREGLRTGHGNRWSVQRIAALRSHHQIPAYSAARQDTEGWLTLTQAAERLGVATLTLRNAIDQGQIAADHPLANGPWMIHRDAIATPQAQAVLERAKIRRGDPAQASRADKTSLFTNTSPEEAV